MLSTVLLNISSRTCNRPHLHSPKRTVIRPELSAGTCQPFSCQRTCIPDPIRGPDLVGTPSFRRALYGLSLATYCQKSSHKIRNPASSAGHSRLVLAASREAQHELPCANKAPHYRICSLEYFRPDCESPARSHTFRKCRTICNLTIRRKYVKWVKTLFFGAFHTPVDTVQNAKSPATTGFYHHPRYSAKKGSRHSSLGPLFFTHNPQHKTLFDSRSEFETYSAAAAAFGFFFSASAVQGGVTLFIRA